MEREGEIRKGAALDCGLFLGLAFLFRIAFVFATPRMLDTADAIHYIETAKAFAQGNFWGFNAKIPILYPALTAAVHGLASDFETAAMIVSLIASTLLVLPVYALSRDLHGRGPARIMALLIAIWPWLLDYACRVGPDALGCTLWFCAIWALARGMRTGGAWMAAAPIFFFALHLTRPEGTVLFAAAFPAAIGLSWGAKPRHLLRLAPLAIGCGVLIGGYALYMRGVTGAATLNYRVQFIAREFDWTLMAATALRTFSDVLPVMLGPALLIFLGVGLFHRAPAHAANGEYPPRDFRLECYVLFFAALQWTANLSVMSAEPRYLMSVIVALALWSARGIAVIGTEADSLRKGRWLRWLPVTTCVLLMLLGDALAVGRPLLDRRPSQPLEYKAAGQWMKANLVPGMIFTRKPQVGYYADMPSTGPDTGDSLEKAIDRAKRAGARYVVVDERYTAAMVPALAPLLDPASAPAALRHVVTLAPYPQSKVVIYELAQPASSGP